MNNAYLFAGIAMLLWGIAPLFAKLGLAGAQPLAALTIRSLIITAILVIVVSITGQWGSVSGVTAKTIIFIALEAICAALLGQLAYYYAIKFDEIGRVSPLAAAFPLVALFLGIIFLGEKVTILKVAAASLIVAGVILLRY